MHYLTLFQFMIEKDASDMFLKPGCPPAYRIAGQVHILDTEPLDEKSLIELYESITDERSKEIFETNNELDTAYEIPQVGRFRVNIFRQRTRMAFCFRHVKTRIPSLEELNLPAETLKKLAEMQRGLFLATGVAGSGKSTTLAAMIEHINNTMCRHIVTIEDPIEFVFTDKKCIIDQRELGIDTHSYEAALKHVVRQSPDVIMIGEMRDRETVEAALNAAETGHLVLSTLHTVNAYQTVERMMNLFPTHQHEFLRQQLSLLLVGVVSLRLLPTKDGTRRVPAVEIMLGTPTIRELLHEGRFRELHKAIKEGTFYGTCTFNQSLKKLVTEELISIQTALAASDNPDELKLELRGIQKGTKAADFDFNF